LRYLEQQPQKIVESNAGCFGTAGTW